MRLVLAGALLIALVPGTAGAARYGPRDTGVVSVSNSPGLSEGEEPLSVNPRNPAEMVTVANVFEPNAPAPLQAVFGGGGVDDSRVYSTQDGGLHWRTFKLDQGGLGHVAPPAALKGSAPEFSDAFNIVNTDADSIWDAAGNVYFESGDIHGINHGGREVATVWRSSDGGVTWGPPNGYTAVDATQEHNELDRPWFAVDRSSGPFAGRLYMTFETTPFAEIPPEVYVKHSDDHGRTWSATTRVDDGLYSTQFNARQRPVVGSDGALYVLYNRAPPSVTPFNAQSGAIQVVVARSTDGGQSFRRVVADADVHRVTDPDEATPSYSEMIGTIATDPSRAGRVAVAWPEAVGADSSRIVARISVDGGEHWGPRIDLADDPSGAKNQHDHVTLAWLDGGPLFAGWRDRRCCGGGWSDRYQQWVRAVSVGRSGATTLGKVLEYSEGPQPGTTSSGRGALQPDEFQGLVATRLGVALTWSQLSGGLDELMFRRVPLTAFGVASAHPIHHPARKRHRHRRKHHS